MDFVCPICGQRFQSLLALRVHFTQVHTRYRFLCPCCGREMSMDRFRFHLTMRARSSGPSLDECHKALAFIASKYKVTQLMRLFRLESMDDVKKLLERLYEELRARGFTVV